jgi:hypothetical protein
MRTSTEVPVRLLLSKSSRRYIRRILERFQSNKPRTRYYFPIPRATRPWPSPHSYTSRNSAELIFPDAHVERMRSLRAVGPVLALPLSCGMRFR